MFGGEFNSTLLLHLFYERYRHRGLSTCPLGLLVSLEKLSNHGTPFRVDPAMTKLGNYAEWLLYKLLLEYLLAQDNRISIDNLQGGGLLAKISR